MKWSGMMNRINVLDFKENDRIKTSLLITQITKGITNSGAPYASFVLQDQSGSIEAKLWDAKEELLVGLDAGKVATVDAEVLKYRQSLQLKLFSIQALSVGDFNPSDFVAASPVPEATLREAIKTAIQSIQNTTLKSVSKAIIDMYGDKVYTHPAAMRNHHDFVGGLATHMCSMIQIAEALVQIYPQLNRDLLISGILLHDLGKIDELSGPILTEYTLSGKLIGHISILQSHLDTVATQLRLEESEEVLLLRHMILSHHGQYEYGSPMLPMFMEAEMLNYIDNVDARLNMFDKALKPIQEGEWTPRIFALENRMFYKPKL
jgi:3'-5' exoribonuclease